MAKITSFPAQAIIDGFKGSLDFYEWKGIPCVRSWPKSPGQSRSPLVQATWPAFTYATKAWSLLPPDIQALWRQQAAGTRLSSKDMFMRGYLSGWTPP